MRVHAEPAVRGPTDAAPSVEIGSVTVWAHDLVRRREDALAVEEPLELRLAGCRVAVTMRTPGDDFDLAAGFLYTEGIIRSVGDIASLAYCTTDDAESEGNIVNVNPADPSLVDPDRWRRNFYTTSSCGICGKASIEAVRQDAPPIESNLQVGPETLCRMNEALRQAQDIFRETGGLHAAGLFDASGTLITLREDVGRHNAVDKVIGHALRAGTLPLSSFVLMVSGRASFEIVQKALMAGIPIVAAVSAPSSLAVQLARSANMTLAGFLRGQRFNLYAGAERVTQNPRPLS